MRTLGLVIAAAGAIAAAAWLTSANAMMPGAPTGAAAEDLSIVDQVHCVPGLWHHRYRPHDGCYRRGLIVAPLIVRHRVFVGPRFRTGRVFVGRGGFRGGARFRRSDIRLKHDVALLGRLDNGLGFYRFSYNGSDQAYVGVMAQEVQTVMPEAVMQGRDGYLRVSYDKLGLTFQTWDAWKAAGAVVPETTRH
jgi:hypothetical protein